MTHPRLEGWSLHRNGDRYTAPEVATVIGLVYGHPRFQDGDRVTTAPVVAFKAGRILETRTRSYLLGEPDPAWVAWCREHGHADPESLIPAVPGDALLPRHREYLPLFRVLHPEEREALARTFEGEPAPLPWMAEIVAAFAPEHRASFAAALREQA